MFRVYRLCIKANLLSSLQCTSNTIYHFLFKYQYYHIIRLVGLLVSLHHTAYLPQNFPVIITVVQRKDVLSRRQDDINDELWVGRQEIDFPAQGKNSRREEFELDK